MAGGKVTKEPPRIELTAVRPLQPPRAQPRGACCSSCTLPSHYSRRIPNEGCSLAYPAQRITLPGAWQKVFFLFYFSLSPWKDERSDFAVRSRSKTGPKKVEGGGDG